MLFSMFKLGDTSAEGSPAGRSTLKVLGSVGDIRCTLLVDRDSDITYVSSKLPGIDKLNLHPKV